MFSIVALLKTKITLSCLGHLPGYKVVTAVPAMVLEDDQPTSATTTPVKEAKNGKFLKSIKIHQT